MSMCVRIYIKINSPFGWLWSKSGRVTISLRANLGVLALSETLDKEGREMTAGNNKEKLNKKTRIKKGKKTKKQQAPVFFEISLVLNHWWVLRCFWFKSTGTEYHSAALIREGTRPSVKRPHKQTQTHTHTSLRDTPHVQPPHLSAGALDHCSCCPTLFRMGKISTVNLQAVSHADPPDPRRILQ